MAEIPGYSTNYFQILNEPKEKPWNGRFFTDEIMENHSPSTSEPDEKPYNPAQIPGRSPEAKRPDWEISNLLDRYPIIEYPDRKIFSEEIRRQIEELLQTAKPKLKKYFTAIVPLKELTGVDPTTIEAGIIRPLERKGFETEFQLPENLLRIRLPEGKVKEIMAAINTTAEPNSPKSDE